MEVKRDIERTLEDILNKEELMAVIELSEMRNQACILDAIFFLLQRRSLLKPFFIAASPLLRHLLYRGICI